MTNELKFNAADEQATAALGAALAVALVDSALPTAVIALIGPLGAGKTRLVQAVARAAGVAEGIVASPTFVLIHEYEGSIPIYHFDAYRLQSEVEFAALAPEEYFARPGWSFIEWADRVPDCLPRDQLEISILLTSPTIRQITIRAYGAQYEKILSGLSKRLTCSC